MVKQKKQSSHLIGYYTLAVTRIMVGFIFLWAFLDKTMGLGFATAKGKAWVDGVSPTSGFLKFGVNEKSPFVDFFHDLAGNPFIDWLFMLGLLGIGLALILGIGVRIAAVSATILLAMMWAAELPLENNPIIDDHLVYIAIIWVVALMPRKLSFIDQWLQNDYVKKHQWLW